MVAGRRPLAHGRGAEARHPGAQGDRRPGGRGVSGGRDARRRRSRAVPRSAQRGIPSSCARSATRIGGEARRKGAHVLLAPTVNIHRHPLAGRNFECYSEDPYLSARMAVGTSAASSPTGVGCSVKHFVANDSEFERMTISSEVDERTLREISLVPFEAAVHEAHTWSVMAAYNRLHGTYCSEHPLLDRAAEGRVELRRRDHVGLVRHAQHRARGQRRARSRDAGARAMVRCEPRRRGARGRRRAKTSLDDKVRRMLLLLERTGGLDTPDFGPEQSIDDPEDRAIVRRGRGRELRAARRTTTRRLPIVATRPTAPRRRCSR